MSLVVAGRGSRLIVGAGCRWASSGAAARVSVPSVKVEKAPWHSARILHVSSIGMAVLTPVAVVLSPSAVCMPVDLALSLVMPAHSAFAMKCVIEDYVPRGAQGITTAAWFAVCGFTAFGLLKLSVSGPGLTNTVKELWRD